MYRIKSITGLDGRCYEIYCDDIWPKLGHCNQSDKVITIEKRLTGSAYDATVSHELSHTRDYSYESGFVKELRANIYALNHHPIGWFKCLWITVTSWDRWKLYLNKVI